MRFSLRLGSFLIALVVLPVATSSPTPASTSLQRTATISGRQSVNKVTYGGINIAGFDFGCDTKGMGACNTSKVTPPGQNGIDQMTHFHSKGLNAFRLPVSWQYLTNNIMGGTLDATKFANYDELVQGCLDSGASMCMVDIHNYARWNSKIIGQSGPSGPTDDQFADLWRQLAVKYKGKSQVAFGIMNEPHDLNMTIWVNTVQAAVTAIRNAGATANIILLPGTNHQAAGGFANNSGGLAAIKNPDGSKTNLVFDVHQYLDYDSSGTHSDCTTDGIDAAFKPLATWARGQNREVFLSETGGGSNDTSCIKYLGQTLQYLNENSDVYLGWTTWAAGSFSTSYVLSETPSGDVDQPLVAQCIIPAFTG